MPSLLSLIMNNFNKYSKSMTASLKRRIYGKYTFLNKTNYHILLMTVVFVDLVLCYIIYFLLNLIIDAYKKHGFASVHQLSNYISISFVIVALILFIIITYDLLFYPRMYLKNEQPTCFYYSNNEYRKGIVIDLIKNKALIKDVNKNNYTNEYLRLINIDDIRYIHKYSRPKGKKLHFCKILYKLLDDNIRLKLKISKHKSDNK